jgi:hypothetical protein
LEHGVGLCKEGVHGFQGIHLVVLVDEVDDALRFFVADVLVVVADLLDMVAADVVCFADRCRVVTIRYWYV